MSKSNEEAGRDLDRAERELREARHYLTVRDRNPGEYDPALKATIPKAALVLGGLVVEHELNKLMTELPIEAMLLEVVKRLEEKARLKMDEALDAQNARRRALGLPPLAPMPEPSSVLHKPRGDNEPPTPPEPQVPGISPEAPSGSAENIRQSEAPADPPPAPPAPPPPPYRNRGAKKENTDNVNG